MSLAATFAIYGPAAEPDFLDLLHRLRAEVEQYLNVADFSRRGGGGYSASPR
jgi:hypothetical protein